MIHEHGVAFGNDNRPTHYWTSHDSMGESIIDLDLANQQFGKWMILATSHATGSDHEIIEWELDMEIQEEAGGTQVIRGNLAAMTQDDVEVSEELWRQWAAEWAHLGAESMGDEVESEAKWFREALIKVLNPTAKQITICMHSKRWWNGEIKEMRSQMDRKKRRRRWSAATAQAKAERQKSVRRVKDKLRNDYLKILTGAEVWRAAKFANPWAGMTVEALTDRDGKQANTIAEHEEMLRPESFPLNEYDQFFELPPAGEAHQSITEHAAERALFSQSVRQAPGPDILSFEAVQLLWRWEKERIVEIAKAAVKTGRHPAVWKRASGVVFRNPGNDDSTKLTAYRSISQLRCIGKVVETVVAELLAEEAERRGLLSDSQFGSRKRRSAIDAAAIMVDRAHATWREGTAAGVLLMDIKAAFPRVGRGRLVHTTMGKGIDGDSIRWTARFRSDRTVEMVIESNDMERRPMAAGIPQGSPQSPILFAVYTTGLIK